MTAIKPAEVFHPGEFIREELEARGWTQSDLANIVGRPVPTINLIIAGKKAVTPETATALGEAFGTSAELWLNLQSGYDLSLVHDTGGAIRRRAQMYDLAPVKEMERRGWIRHTDSPTDLESELCRFFRVPNLAADLPVFAAARQSATDDFLTAAQRAWCVRALQLAESVLADAFDPSRMDDCIREIRSLAAHAEDTRRIGKVLASYGIRFVVVEHLNGTKIDGAALWLAADKPVIAVSIRYDRINSFWHTLCHELSHIKHRDNAIVDTDLIDDPDSERAGLSPIFKDIEDRANAEGAAMLVPPSRLQSFMIRVRPYYSKQRIIQFAHTIGVHPGIIAGQLQHRNEIKYSANQEMLVKVRSIVTSEAVTDGWGKMAVE